MPQYWNTSSEIGGGVLRVVACVLAAEAVLAGVLVWWWVK